MITEPQAISTRSNGVSTRVWGLLARWRPSLIPLLAAGLALLFLWGITQVEYAPRRGFHIVTRGVISGDGPHYLIILNSILFDHSLEVQHAYDRSVHGGLDAGARFRHGLVDHHTIIVNRSTGHHTFWSFSIAGWPALRNPRNEFRPGPDVYEVPSHPVAFPALLALALAPFHPAPAQVEPEAGLVLVLIGWLGVVATYLMARAGGFSRTPALAAAGVLMLASPWLPYCRDYFSETTIGLCLALAMLAWSKDRPVIAALLAAGATFIKPSFAVVGAGFLIETIRERRLRDTFAMTVALGISAAALMGFNYWLAGKLLIGGTWDWHIAHYFDSFQETMFEPGHGLLIFAPWTILAPFGIAQTYDRFDADDAVVRMLRRMAWPLILYLVLMAMTGFGPGYCYGPRFWVPFLPWLAVAAVQTVRTAGRRGMVTGVALIAIGMAIAIPGTLQLPRVYSEPVAAAWP
ncbi:MAG: hypothetical protein ACYDC3_08260 [Candidatus Binataceae bacterium]